MINADGYPIDANASISAMASAGSSNTTAPCICAILPIELTSFDAAVEEDNVILTWQTASEVNNELFEIQRSLDEESWMPIGQVQGLGNSSQLQDYHFTDQFPMAGTSYYRLKQQDINGEFTYSMVREVVVVSSFQHVSLYPNPTTGIFTVQGATDEIQVFDQYGRLVLNSKVPTIDMSNYINGIYFVRAGEVITKLVLN